MEIRPILPDEVAQGFALRLRALKEERPSFGDTYEEEVGLDPEEVKRRFTPTGDDFILVAIEDGAWLGMVGFRRGNSIKHSHTGMIWGMFVGAEARGKGVGRALLGEAIRRGRVMDGLEQMKLCVHSEAQPARQLYLSFGFETWGIDREVHKFDGGYVHLEHMVLWLKK